MDGEVCSGIYGESDKYIDVTFDKKKSYDSFCLKHKIGQDLKKGDTLYHVGGKEYKSEYNGRIVSQEITKEYAHITIMDYDSLVIAASLDLEKLQQIKIGKKVTIKLQNEKGKNKKIKSKIVGIGSTVEDGKVDIYISNKGKLLLGTKMKVSYTNKKKAKSLYILKKMLINDGDVYYVNVLEGNKKLNNIVINRALKYMEQFNLSGMENKKVSLLSGGEKQRVAMVRAIIKEPKVVIADEPTGNLDTENTKIIIHAFRELANKGTTIIIVTHDTGIAEKTDKRYRMIGGQLQAWEQ